MIGRGLPVNLLQSHLARAHRALRSLRLVRLLFEHA
jgi:hypothetical protein